MAKNPYMKYVNGGQQDDDQTEAQINEGQKENPLTGYGFQTSREKQTAVAMQAAQYKAVQQQMMMQAAQADPQTAMRIYLQMAGMQAGEKAKQRTQPPINIDDDPEIQEFTTLTNQTQDPVKARMELGRRLVSRGDVRGVKMLQEAKAMQAEQQKQTADLQGQELSNTGQEVDNEAKMRELPSAGKAYKIGQNVEMDVDVNGRPMKKTMQVTGYGDDGLPTYKEIARGSKALVQDTNEGFAGTKKTDSQQGSGVVEFEKQLQGTANALDVYDEMEKVVKESPHGGGVVGRFANIGTEAIGEIRAVGDLIKQTSRNDLSKVTLDLDKPEYKESLAKLNKMGINNAKMRSLVVNLAYAQAAANDSGSRTISDSDVANMMVQIGGQMADPAKATTLFRMNKQLLVKKLHNTGNYTLVDGKDGRQAVGSMYKDQMKELEDRVNKDPEPTSDQGNAPKKAKFLGFETAH